MPGRDDPRDHQYDPRHERALQAGCFTCHRPRAQHTAPEFVALPNGHNRVYWKGQFIGIVKRGHGEGRKTWTFERPGDNHHPGFWLPSRREAVDWLLGH